MWITPYSLYSSRCSSVTVQGCGGSPSFTPAGNLTGADCSPYSTFHGAMSTAHFIVGCADTLRRALSFRAPAAATPTATAPQENHQSGDSDAWLCGCGTRPVWKSTVDAAAPTR